MRAGSKARMSASGVGVREPLLLQLTIFAAFTVVEFNRLPPFFKFSLTFDTQSNPPQCLATSFRNSNLALLAMSQAFALRKPAFGQLNSRFHGGIYLFLHRPISGPTSCHDVFLIAILTFCSLGKPIGSVYSFARGTWTHFCDSNDECSCLPVARSVLGGQAVPVCSCRWQASSE